MTTIEVQLPGMFTTVQDLGRVGFGAMGVSPSGAADAVSLRIGNRLVGNDESAAALEMTLLGGTFRFPRGAIMALSGSEFDSDLDGTPIERCKSIRVRPGQTLRIGLTRSGARSYLCVQGGIDAELFLGSASTHALTGLGGLDGRPLKKGDVLKIGPATDSFRERKIDPRVVEDLLRRDVLRVTEGPQSDWFPPDARRGLSTSVYCVTEESGRTGLRLKGPPAVATPDRQMITEGVSLGAVQVPPSGQPIILFVDQQTTGGYPKIANVISADLHRLGQLRPRDEIRFEQIETEAALSLLRQQEELLTSDRLIRK